MRGATLNSMNTIFHSLKEGIIYLIQYKYDLEKPSIYLEVILKSIKELNKDPDQIIDLNLEKLKNIKLDDDKKEEILFKIWVSVIITYLREINNST